jgi:exopolyphosphatase / guanosine-5'-triphosphate,3'-diphosphate pyrophosphatase
LVSDIGGGSTEFVTSADSISIDIGSVRLTDRLLGESPAPASRVAEARLQVSEMFQIVDLFAREVVGVAGTWTSLSALTQDLARYEREVVHGSTVSLSALSALVDSLAQKSLGEIEAIPSLDPKRAPVILAGAIIAEGALRHLGLEQAKISERDTLDGVAGELLALL